MTNASRQRVLTIDRHYHQDSFKARNPHLSSVAVSQQLADALEKETWPIPLPATSEPSTAEERLALSSSGYLMNQDQPRLCESDPGHQSINGPAVTPPLSRSLTALTGTTIFNSAQSIKSTSTWSCTPLPFTPEMLSTTGTVKVYA